MTIKHQQTKPEILERRYKIIYVLPELFFKAFLTGTRGVFTTIEGVPEETLYRGAFFDVEYQKFGIVLYHKDWNIVPEYDRIPEFSTVTFQTHTCNKGG